MDNLNTSTEADATAALPALQITLNPAATYSQRALAEAFGCTVRTLQRLRRRGRGKFPRPFILGSKPYWTGRAVQSWLAAKQEEAMS